LTREERKQYNYNLTHKIIDGILHKKCNHHFEHFPEEDDWFPCTDKYFYNNTTKSINTDGLHPECRLCTIKKSEKWKREQSDDYNKEKKRKLRALGKENIRTNKNGIKESEKAIREVRQKNGKQLAWQRANADKFKGYREKRELTKKHVISTREWLNCKSYFNNCCAYCGLKLEDHFITRLGIVKNSDFHKDHVDDKGANDLSNCLPACRSCNSSKHTSSLDEWYNENNSAYTELRYNKLHKWLSEDYREFIKRVL